MPEWIGFSYYNAIGGNKAIFTCFFFFKKKAPCEKANSVDTNKNMYTCGGFILIFGKTNTVM